ncbi:hypothetical protein LINPERPRIM_LOCUS18697 [Linum perenne]
MIHQMPFEAVDRTMCDLMNTPTEGPNHSEEKQSSLVPSGDFRQSLLVIKKFSQWVLVVGDGQILKPKPPSSIAADWIKILRCFIVHTSSTPISDIVNRVYPDLTNSYHSVAYIRSRAIVTPVNRVVTKINDYILSQIPRQKKVYLSINSLTTPDPNQTALEMQYLT